MAQRGAGVNTGVTRNTETGVTGFSTCLTPALTPVHAHLQIRPSVHYTGSGILSIRFQKCGVPDISIPPHGRFLV